MVQTAAAWIHRSVAPPEPFSLNKLLSRGDVAHRLEEIGPPLDIIQTLNWNMQLISSSIALEIVSPAQSV